MSSHYTVSLPVKPHIRKYIHAIEGDTIKMNSHSMLCHIVRAFLENANKCGMSKSDVTTYFQTRDQKIDIQVPIKKLGIVGHSLRPDSAVLINRFLEDMFEQDLLKFVQDFTREGGRYRGFKEAYLTFAKLFNIVIDEDITFDNLKKIEYRTRQKKTEKNFHSFVPSPERYN